MASAAELKLLEKSLGLSKGNKYSAQGERQVRRRGGTKGK
jgi:translation elongation factor 1 epsilon-1